MAMMDGAPIRRDRDETERESVSQSVRMREPARSSSRKWRKIGTQKIPRDPE